MNIKRNHNLTTDGFEKEEKPQPDTFLSQSENKFTYAIDLYLS